MHICCCCCCCVRQMASAASASTKRPGKESSIYIQCVRSPACRYDRPGNGWWVISQMGKKAQISPVLVDQPDCLPDDDGAHLQDSGCVLVGSYLYLIGGENQSDKTYSSVVRCIDISNPGEGWKTCFSLPFATYEPLTEASGRWIYVILGDRQRGRPFSKRWGSWGYVFNVDNYEDQAYPLLPPPDWRPPEYFSNLDNDEDVRAPGGYPDYLPVIAGFNNGLLVFMPDKGTFYFHDPVKQEWSVYHVGVVGFEKMDFRQLCAFSDGRILYYFDQDHSCLLAFDVVLRQPLSPIQIPKSWGFWDDPSVRLVSLHEPGKLCFISYWHPMFIRDCDIVFAKFSVSHGSSAAANASAVILEKWQVFRISGSRIMNCLAITNPCQDEAEEDP